MDKTIQTTREELEGNKVKVTVSIDASEIDGRIAKTYKDFSRRYNFPGFRRGHVPRPVIDNAFGSEGVRANVTDAVVNEAYLLAIDKENLYPLSSPDFDEPQLVEAGKPYSFAFTVECKPALELSNYDPVEITLPSEDATEEEINSQIDSVREYYHVLEDDSDSAEIAEGGFVRIALTATDDAGEAIGTLESSSRLYVLGSGLFPKAFDDQLVGMKKGQKKAFSIDVPDATESALMASLAGKTQAVAFEVEVLSVEKRVLPELTDEWVKETLSFDSVEDFRTRVSESIKAQKAAMLPRMKENACLVALMERLEGDVPDVLVEDAESNLLQNFFTSLQHRGMTFDAYLQQAGMNAETFKADIKKQAVDTAKQDLALDAWARHFNMECTEEDIASEFEKSGADDPKALYEQWRKSGQLHLVRQGVLRARAATDVMDGAKVSTSESTPESASEGAVDEKAADEEAADEEAAAAEKVADKEAAADEKVAAEKATAEKAADEKATAKKAAAEKASE